MEEEKVTHSSIFAWEIQWTEDPASLQSMGLQKSWAWLGNWACMHTIDTVNQLIFEKLYKAFNARERTFSVNNTVNSIWEEKSWTLISYDLQKLTQNGS